VIKISFGRMHDFCVKMWGVSSPDDKLAGDLGNVIEATSIGGRRLHFFTAEKLAPGNLRLLQQYLPGTDLDCNAAISGCSAYSMTSSATASSIGGTLNQAASRFAC
jgi:hypothetical protein